MTKADLTLLELYLETLKTLLETSEYASARNLVGRLHQAVKDSRNEQSTR